MSQPIHVDIDALQRLAAELSGLSTALDRSGHGGFSAHLDDPYIASALIDVEHDWSKMRRVICGYLDGVADAAGSAAAAYAAADHAVITR